MASSIRRSRTTPSARQTRKQPSSRQARPRRWSKQVKTDALDLEEGVFRARSARAVALSLKRSAERSGRRKSEPFQSAMSMLNLYVNRAGRKLSPERRRVLSAAKHELRRVFHRA